MQQNIPEDCYSQAGGDLMRRVIASGCEPLVPANALDPNPLNGEPTGAEPEASKASAGETMKPQITLITKRDVPALMSKLISLTNDGKVHSDGSECRMAVGTAERAFVPTAAALAEIVANCRSDQALALGALKSVLASRVKVTTKAHLPKTKGAIARAQGYIDYLPGVAAWALIDFDSKGMTDDLKTKIDAMGGMWAALLSVAPELARAARVSRASTSAGLYRTDTNDQIVGSNGAHHFVLVKDGGDIDRFLKALHDRCWLNGFGWHMVGKAGQLLDRSIVDRMVGSGERLCFEGAPRLVAPLAQDQTKRQPAAFDGVAIDTVRAGPPLSKYERHRLAEAKDKSVNALDKAAREVRTKHDGELAEKISKASGLPLVTARRLVAARHKGVLFPDVELEFDHIGSVNVGAVLADPDRYVGETLADPMEGIVYGRCKALVMMGTEGDLIIHSFAHGRSIYSLKYDLKAAKAAFEQIADATVDHAMEILSRTEIEEDELSAFVKLVSKTTGVREKPIKDRVRKEQNTRAVQANQASMEAEAEGRIVRPRPEPDGELTPVVSFLDEVLAEAKGDEPPMRNAVGALVRVEYKQPWALHLLTSDGANSLNDEAEIIEPPAEPVFVELTATGTELLVENFVCWTARNRENSPYFACLPAPFIKALMEYPSSAIPVAHAINTSPLVMPSGRVIDGVGLDRKTGLFHRIDPVLRSCVPTTPPTEENIKDALKFLLNDWLVDVALDPAGKCVAVLLALTILQRALLPERPAFFVTAGQRGGGKTTLVGMIIAAVLGRRATAANWSDSVEERKKAVFSYLRQGVATLVWDNIARGSNISCPHIEAALTATETSDRVLGVSKVECVASTTIQIFTGNSIAPLGEMASRSFVIALKVDRPDPENRSFVHPDPLSWSQANRAKILRAFYTILIGGASQRPKDQIAKTCFKVWWTSIGWPVEYAAGLLGINFNSSELLRAGEADDQEATTASRVLSILRKRWRDKPFTARQVKLALDAANAFVEESAERAQELADALAELTDKPIDKLTVRGIGKLFQKNLTDRPTWIDGDVVAVLRKVAGHQENAYRVEVQQEDAEERAVSASPDDFEPDPF